jgi:hypothetical protein
MKGRVLSVGPRTVPPMSQEMLPERWNSRDLPVLRAAAAHLESEEHPPVRVSDLCERTGLDEDAVIRACQALHPTYISGKPLATMGGVTDFFVTGLTDAGRRATGLWPNGDDAVAQFLDALRQAEDLVEDPEDKTALRKAGGQLATVSRSVVAEVIAAVVTRQAGIG